MTRAELIAEADAALADAAHEIAAVRQTLPEDLSPADRMELVRTEAQFAVACIDLARLK